MTASNTAGFEPRKALRTKGKKSSGWAGCLNKRGDPAIARSRAESRKPKLVRISRGDVSRWLKLRRVGKLSNRTL